MKADYWRSFRGSASRRSLPCGVPRAPRLSHALGQGGSRRAPADKPQGSDQDRRGAAPHLDQHRPADRARLRRRLPAPDDARQRRPLRSTLLDRPRHPGAHLCDAGMGAEHRGRARRALGPRLRRLLRHRGLFLRHPVDHLPPLVLAVPAASPECSRPLGACCSAFRCLRLRGDYLAIVTLAFGEIIRLVLINWVPVTNGGAGIASIPRASFFGCPSTMTTTALPRSSVSNSRPCTGSSSSST